MRRRVFLAIPVPEKAKRLIATWQRAHVHIPVRWIKPENLHITLVPPWYAAEDELYESVKAIERAAAGAMPFAVVFEKALWGPTGGAPRLIWAAGEPPQEFNNLRISIEGALFENSGTGFIRKEMRPAKLHLTLARLRPGYTKNLPPLEDTVDWKFEINEILLMEPELKREGAEYAILQTFSF